MIKSAKSKNMEKGITLVALVVTIVILLILAGITLNLVLSDDGIFGKAQEAKNKWEEAEQNETNALNNLYNRLENLLDNTNSDNVTLKGTWKLNDEINYPSDFFFDFGNKPVTISNEEYTFEFVSIEANNIFGYDIVYTTYEPGGNAYAPYAFAYIPENELGFPSGWVWGALGTREVVKTVSNIQITITSELSEVLDADEQPAGEQLLNWLKANAVKQ